jgi:type IV secretory pathway component VirB8
MSEGKKPGLISKIKLILSVLIIAVLASMISSVIIGWMLDCMRTEMFLIQELGWSPSCHQ